MPRPLSPWRGGAGSGGPPGGNSAGSGGTADGPSRHTPPRQVAKCHFKPPSGAAVNLDQPGRGKLPQAAPGRLPVEPRGQLPVEAEPHRATAPRPGFLPEQQRDMQGLARQLESPRQPRPRDRPFEEPFSLAVPRQLPPRTLAERGKIGFRQSQPVRVKSVSGHYEYSSSSLLFSSS